MGIVFGAFMESIGRALTSPLPRPIMALRSGRTVAKPHRKEVVSMNFSQDPKSSIAMKVRNFLRFATGATDPDVFYFSLNGMVMPLSRR